MKKPRQSTVTAVFIFNEAFSIQKKKYIKLRGNYIMRLGFSQQEIKGTLAELNLPEHSYYMRRAARALDIVNQDKVHFLMEGVSQASHAGEDVFRVDSQYDDKHYHVEINHGNPGCTCEDFKKNGVSCKHMIAATIYSESLKSGLTIYDDTNNSYHGRGGS